MLNLSSKKAVNKSKNGPYQSELPFNKFTTQSGFVFKNFCSIKIIFSELKEKNFNNQTYQ